MKKMRWFLRTNVSNSFLILLRLNSLVRLIKSSLTRLFGMDLSLRTPLLIHLIRMLWSTQ